MRPRFQLEVPLDPAEVHRRLQAHLACAGCPCHAVVVGDHVDVMIREDLRHTWSPRLSLEVRAHSGGTMLYGLFGPNPNVWSMFLAGYAVFLISAGFSGLLGLVQLSLGQPAWGLWVLAGCLLGCGLPYGGSLVGQRLAAEQMELLRCFLQESLGVVHERTTSEYCPPRPLPLVEDPPSA